MDTTMTEKSSDELAELVDNAEAVLAEKQFTDQQQAGKMQVTPQVALEPRCTRCSEFHFLEHLLEKMVRMESKIEAVQSDSQGQITLLRDRIGELEAKEKGAAQSLNAMTQKVTKLEGDLQTADGKVKELSAELRQSMAAQQELVEQQRNLQVNKPVAFLAKLDQPLHDLQEKDVVIFNTVLTNLGDGYNPDTGFFVAPVSGVYVFSVSVMSEPDKRNEIELYLVKNGTIMTGVRAFPATTNHNQGSTTAVIEVAASDKVWVRVHLPDTDAAIGAWHFSSFTGCLIHQL